MDSGMIFSPVFTVLDKKKPAVYIQNFFLFFKKNTWSPSFSEDILQEAFT